MMFDTKFYTNRWRPLNFRRIWFFYFFLSWRQILKIRCIHEASSVRKPKSSNVLSRKKNFVKSMRKQFRNPDSNPLFLFTHSPHSFLANCTEIWVILHKESNKIYESNKKVSERKGLCYASVTGMGKTCYMRRLVNLNTNDPKFTISVWRFSSHRFGKIPNCIKHQ